MASDAPADMSGPPADERDERDQDPRASSLAAYGPRAPGWLRLVRGLVGIVLLVGAWGAMLGAVLLVLDLVGMAAHQHLAMRVAFYVASAVGALWLGAVGVTAVIVGAFSLLLALRNRGW